MSLKSTLETCSAVVLDIEGTTTSISFVKDILFPYVKTNLTTHLETYWDTPDLQEDVMALRTQVQKDLENGMKGIVEIPETDNVEDIQKAVVENVFQQMQTDRKTTALKQLQGHMWHHAYASKEIQGHVYDDVLPMIQRWHKLGKKIFIYSSGSVEAQKLLFKFSTHGNLLEYISGHFDTTTGPKIEAASYESIATQIHLPSDKIAFFTDVVTEATAAKEAGMTSILVVREGNKPLTDADKTNFNVIHSFNELK